MDHNTARLLPRFRGEQVSVLERRRRDRAQARAVLDVVESDSTSAKHEMTKGGDPLELRGLPAIGRSVSGQITGTQPEQAAINAISRQERLRERTELAA